MDALLVGEWATVAMQRHVTVGDIVAENEESHCDVVPCRGDGTAPILAVQHLEVVNDAVGNGFAAVSAVAAVESIRLVEQRRGLAHLLVDGMGGRQLAECGIGAVISRMVLDNMAGAHVLEHLIGVPGTLNDEVTIVFEPSDQGFCFFADIFTDTFNDGLVFGGSDDFQSFDSHKCYPCV